VRLRFLGLRIFLQRVRRGARFVGLDPGDDGLPLAVELGESRSESREEPL